MLTRYIKSLCVIKRMNTNYFNFIFEEYISYLHKNGYTLNTIQCYCRALEHFGCWLEIKKTQNNFINKTILREFIENHIPMCQCKSPCTKEIKSIRAAVNQVLKIILPTNIIEPLTITENNINGIIEGFNEYLIKVCGVANNTIIYRKRYILAFLKETQLQKLIMIEKVTPQQIISFIKRFSSYYASKSIGTVSTSLRSFLKYAALSGFNVERLQNAVPSIPNWRLSQSPKFLNITEINRFLSIFNRKSSSGKRDYAMARCLTDLGLRCCEVSGIKIKNIDWHTGILNINCSKTRKTNQFPLTQSVGDAISDYLLHGRPSSLSEYLFVHHRAPLGKAVRTETVRAVIRYAFKKSGFNPAPSPHILRRSLATRLLTAGASLKEIADVLGHKCIDTTMIYTKIDLPHLSLVAMPWFGGSYE